LIYNTEQYILSCLISLSYTSLMIEVAEIFGLIIFLLYMYCTVVNLKIAVTQLTIWHTCRNNFYNFKNSLKQLPEQNTFSMKLAWYGILRMCVIAK
jgi:hypothetical protein